MDNRELAAEIVKTALQNGQFIQFLPSNNRLEETVSQANEFNAKQISEFYRIIYDNISNN